MQLFLTSLMLGTPILTAKEALEILKSAERVNYKGFEPSSKVNFVFSGNH